MPNINDLRTELPRLPDDVPAIKELTEREIKRLGNVGRRITHDDPKHIANRLAQRKRRNKEK